MLFDVNPPVEVDEIGATAEKDMLAVVHDLTGTGMLIRGGSSAQKWTALK
jgi:hypothetical protein